MTTYEQVQPGAKQDFVEALFGPPTQVVALEDGEIWKWTYREEVQSSTGVIFVISAKNSTQTQDAVFVEFKGGQASRIWRDE